MKLYYGFDSMCVFCYGFSPLIKKLYDNYNKEIEFEILPAAMWRDDTAKKVTPAVAQKLKQSIQRVGKMTGQSYGEGFIKYLATGPTLNSYDGSKALNTIIKASDINPFDYLDAYYDLLFIKGKNTAEVKFYSDIAVSLGMTKDNFLTNYNSEEIEKITNDKIELLIEKNITSYPSVVIEKDGELETYPLNYVSYEELENWLKQYL